MKKLGTNRAADYLKRLFQIFCGWSKTPTVNITEIKRTVPVEPAQFPWQDPKITPIDGVPLVSFYRAGASPKMKSAPATMWLSPLAGVLFTDSKIAHTNIDFSANLSQQMAADFERVFEHDLTPQLMKEFILMWLDLNHARASTDPLYKRWKRADEMHGHLSGPETFRTYFQGMDRLMFNLENDLLSINQAILLEINVSVLNAELEFGGTLNSQEMRWVKRLHAQSKRLFSEKALLRLAELEATSW